MGFGDLFQIEFSSLGLISSITRGSMLIPTLGFKYNIRYAFFFFTFQENFPKFTGTINLSICDTRIKSDSIQGEVVTNPLLLFLGSAIKVNENTFLVFEASQVSGYRLNPNGTVSEKDLIIGYWLSFGGKCYVFKWLTVNSGIRFDSPEGEFKWTGLSDAKLWMGINLLLPIDYFLGS